MQKGTRKRKTRRARRLEFSIQLHRRGQQGEKRQVTKMGGRPAAATSQQRYNNA